MAVSFVVSVAWYGQNSAQNSSPPGAPGALGDSFFQEIEEKVAHVWPFLATGDPQDFSGDLCRVVPPCLV